MKARDVVILKLSSGEMVAGTVVVPLLQEDQPPFWKESVLLEDVASVQVSKSGTAPNQYTWRLLPWMAGQTHFALDKIVGVSETNEVSQKEYDRVFTKILTPSINEVAGLQMGAHGKL